MCIHKHSIHTDICVYISTVYIYRADIRIYANTLHIAQEVLGAQLRAEISMLTQDLHREQEALKRAVLELAEAGDREIGLKAKVYMPVCICA